MPVYTRRGAEKTKIDVVLKKNTPQSRICKAPHIRGVKIKNGKIPYRVT